jgi:hypothetical protein
MKSFAADPLFASRRAMDFHRAKNIFASLTALHSTTYNPNYFRVKDFT